MLKKTMTKLKIIDQIAKDAKLSKTAAKAALESFINICVQEIKVGYPIRVAGLGTFTMKKVKARKGINPRTGEQIKISAKKRMSFKAATQIKKMLNPGSK